MFLLLRASFWLSLILICFWWGSSSGSKKQGLNTLASASALATKSLNEAQAQLESACIERPKMCIDIASRLNEIIAEHAQDPKAKLENSKAKLENRH
jgi:hypothetical protein